MASKLQRLLPSRVAPGQACEFEVSIIIVAAVAVRATKDSLDGSWRWLSDLLKSLGSKAQVLQFVHAANPGNKSIWQSLSDDGNELLVGLLAPEQHFNVVSQPIIFICHSLGGIVVKKALATIYEQQYIPTYQQLKHAVSGVVFLSTPHPTYSRRAHWSSLNDILKQTANYSKVSLKQAENEAAVVANISLKFEEAGISVPVISAFEDQTSAETSVKYEKLVLASCDHLNICSIREEDDLHQEINLLIQDARKRRIQQRQPPKTVFQSTQYLMQNDKIWTSTISEGSAGPILTPTSTDESKSGPKVTENMDTVQHQNPFNPAKFHKLPYMRNPDFFGREEVLRRLDGCLLPSEHSSDLQTFAICGLGGIGKTKIALEYAYSRSAKYDAVFWVQADEGPKLAEGFARIAEDLGFVEAFDTLDRVIARNLVLEWLSTPRKDSKARMRNELRLVEASWLLIFDNADDIRLLRDYWPIGGNGSVLVTSRDPLAKTDLYPSIGIDLEPFSTEEAATLLTQMVIGDKAPGKDESAAALADRLGGLPLAIVQIAALIHRLGMTTKEFLNFYEEQATLVTIPDADTIVPRNQYKHTLFTVWTFENLSPGASSLLELLSLLDPDCIQENIITEYFQFTPTKPVDERQIAKTLLDSTSSQPSSLDLVVSTKMDGFPTTKTEYINARTELLKSSLIKRNSVRNEVTLHRLVQEVARGRITPSRLLVVFELCLDLLIHAWPKDHEEFSYDTSAWAASDIVLPHMLKLQSVFETALQGDIPVETQRRFAQLLQMSGWYLVERGSFDASRPIFNLALRICRRHPGEMIDVLADVLSSHTFLAADADADKQLLLAFAKEHLKLRLEVGEETEENRDSLSMAYGEVAQAYMLNGDYVTAVEYCDIALEIDSRLEDTMSGNGWPHFCMMRKASSLLALRRTDEAATLMLDTLKFRERRWGPNENQSCKRGMVLEVLADIQAKQGNTAASFETYKQAYDNFVATVGRNHRRTAQVCVKLGEYYARVGQLEEARKHIEQAMKSIGNNTHYRIFIARAVLLIALNHERQGNIEGAKEAMAQAKALYAELVPNYDPNTGPLTEGHFENMAVATPHFW
ncbi:hypothetical protein B7463_g9995, partial [Scytalidium lignicola]